jgi:hypothetical protein
VKVQLNLDLLLDGLTVAHGRLVSPASNRIKSCISEDGQTACKFRFGNCPI